MLVKKPIFFRYLVQHTNREKSTPLIAVRVSLQGVEVHRLEWSIGHLKITSEKISTQNKWNNSFLEISFAIISSQASLSPVKASWWLCLLEKQPTGPAFKKKTPCLWKNEWILFLIWFSPTNVCIWSSISGFKTHKIR